MGVETPPQKKQRAMENKTMTLEQFADLINAADLSYEDNSAETQANTIIDD